MVSNTVSIVLPTYNRADLLEASVESILDQSYKDFELIIIDDGSTDDTEGVVRQYDDNRIKYVKNDENIGATASRNTGIEQSCGEFIAFQNSDDEWDPSKLEKQMKIFDGASSSIGVVYTGMWRVVNGEREYIPSDGIRHKEGDVQESLIENNFISDQMAVVRKDCLQDVGYLDERLAPLDDWELWLRVSRDYKFLFVDEPLVTAEIQSDSISRSTEDLVRARKLIAQKHSDLFDSYCLAKHLFYVGHGSLKINETNTGRSYLLKALRTDPRVLYFGAFLLSFLGSTVYNSVYSTYTGLQKA